MTQPAARDRPVIAAMLLTFACLFWASVFVLGRGTHDTIPPMALTLARHFVAAAVLLPFAWRPLRRQWRLVLSAWPWLLALGVMALGLFPILLLLALARTTALNGSLINSVQPVMTVALAWIATRERVTPRQGLGIMTSLAGVLVIVTRGQPLTILEIGLNEGDLTIVLCLLIWSLYSVALRHVPAALDANLVALCLVLAGLPITIPFFAIEAASGRLPTADWPTLATVVYFGVFPSALALVFWNRGVVALGPNRSGIFTHLIPVFGTIMAIGFLGEQPYAFHAAGMALVIVGVWWTTTTKS